MTVNSESFFRKISSKDKSLDEKERKIKLREDAVFNFQEELRNAQQINPEPFFQQGKQEGIQEGIQIGIQQAAESQPKQKNILGFNEGGLVPNKGAYFEASIGRENARDLKSNVVMESFFDTGKGRSSDSYEERTSDGTTLFKSETELIGSSLTESSYSHTPTITETDEDGGVETFTETETLSSRISSIAKDDLIKHQDQLLGEIHKIKGFEDVTINDYQKIRCSIFYQIVMHHLLQLQERKNKIECQQIILLVVKMHLSQNLRKDIIQRVLSKQMPRKLNHLMILLIP